MLACSLACRTRSPLWVAAAAAADAVMSDVVVIVVAPSTSGYMATMAAAVATISFVCMCACVRVRANFARTSSARTHTRLWASSEQPARRQPANQHSHADWHKMCDARFCGGRHSHLI